MELLPAIDILDGKAVRLAKGDYAQVTVYNEDPADQAQRFEAAGARWLHVVDLDGARTGEPANIALIERILARTLLKVEVGGGLRSLDSLRRLADAGVSRMVLGTSLLADPDFAQAAIEEFGELMCAGIDARAGKVAISGWNESSQVDALELAERMRAGGWRHIVYTDIARDGMQTGIEVAAYERMATAFGGPVIASGGVAGIANIEALGRVADSIEGVIAGRAIYEGSLDLEQACAVCEAATLKAEAARALQNGCGGCRC